MAVFNQGWFLEHRLGPVYILQPVARRGRGQQVDTDFRVQMRRDGNPARLGQGGGPGGALQSAGNGDDTEGAGHLFAISGGGERLRASAGAQPCRPAGSAGWQATEGMTRS